MQHRYFAASNSAEGFRNYFPAIFDRADRLFVIKGGPGTGKSGFMRKCVAAALQRGATVETYACSSDPSSLDGVLLDSEKGRLGILDGTAPHIWEPKSPGAYEELLNLGQFWDGGLLHKQKNEILSLSQKKSGAYNRTYDYLRSCGNLGAVTDALLRQVIDLEKLGGAAERAVRALDLPEGRAVLIPALTRAIGMTGDVRLDSFERNAAIIWRVGELYGVGQLYLSALLSLLTEKKVTLRVSYDPIRPGLPDGILLEEQGIAFVLSERADEEEGSHFVNPRRFVSAEGLREIRGELRYAKKLFDSCLDGALHALAEVRIYHFLLEDLYKNAMDFEALSRFRDDFIAANL